MGTQATNQWTSAAYVYTTLASNFDVLASDPRATNPREGRPNRAIIVINAGSIGVIDLEGTTVDITDSVPAGTLLPIVAKTILASSGSVGVLVLY
jgi:hypothetical protein